MRSLPQLLLSRVVSTPSSMLFFAGLCLLGASSIVIGQDCNENGIDDTVDLTPGPFNLAGAVTYPLGGSFSSLAASDFDGDGDTDLLSLSSRECCPVVDSAVRLHINDGQAGFFERRVILYEEAAGEPVIADLDGDGLPDVVWVHQATDTLHVLRNSAMSIGTINGWALSGNVSTRLLAADIDVDGDIDLVVGLRRADGRDALEVRCNRGDADFGSVRHIILDGVPSALAAADLDDDGRTDLITTTPESMTLLWGRGSDPEVPIETSLPAPRADEIAAHDVDSDGDLDLILRSTDASVASTVVWVLRNEGERRVVAGSLPVVTVFGSADVLIEDLDADGQVDLVLAAGGSSVDSSLVHLVGAEDGSFVEAQRIPVTGLPGAILSGDIDGDGRLDLVLSHRQSAVGWKPSLDLLLGSESEGLRIQPPVALDYEHVFRNETALVLADLNNDGRVDLVGSNRRSRRLLVQLSGESEGFYRPLEVSDRPMPETLFDDLHEVDLDLATGLSTSCRSASEARRSPSSCGSCPSRQPATSGSS